MLTYRCACLVLAVLPIMPAGDCAGCALGQLCQHGALPGTLPASSLHSHGASWHLSTVHRQKRVQDSTGQCAVCRQGRSSRFLCAGHVQLVQQLHVMCREPLQHCYRAPGSGAAGAPAWAATAQAMSMVIGGSAARSSAAQTVSSTAHARMPADKNIGQCAAEASTAAAHDRGAPAIAASLCRPAGVS